MTTKFPTGAARQTTPRGLMVRTKQGDKLITVGLNNRVPFGARVLIVTNEDGPQVMARRQL